MTLSFIPKLFGILLTLAVLGQWMISVLIEFTHRLLDAIPGLLS